MQVSWARTVVQVAGRHAAGGDLAQRRELDPATLERIGTARMEMATRGRRERRRNLALDRNVGPVSRIDAGHLGDEGDGVGMVRMRIEIGGRARLDDAPQ